MRHTYRRQKVYGIDFSGAAQAGKRIWIASGSLDGGQLDIDICQRGDRLPGSGPGRDQCLAALRALILSAPEAIFGLDFPFGLPRPIVEETRWEDFVLGFAERYPSEWAFFESCHQRAGGRELRRLTDVETKTPLSAYNVRLFRQTYYGIRDLLAPLVRDGAACVVPMQSPAPGRPWLIEICPASTLKRECSSGGQIAPYKGRTPAHRGEREALLARLEALGSVHIASANIRTAAIEDAGGDALDSLIAAAAALRAVHEIEPGDREHEQLYAMEGYVYT